MENNGGFHASNELDEGVMHIQKKILCPIYEEVLHLKNHILVI